VERCEVGLARDNARDQKEEDGQFNRHDDQGHEDVVVDAESKVVADVTHYST